MCAPSRAQNALRKRRRSCARSVSTQTSLFHEGERGREGMRTRALPITPLLPTLASFHTCALVYRLQRRHPDENKKKKTKTNGEGGRRTATQTTTHTHAHRGTPLRVRRERWRRTTREESTEKEARGETEKRAGCVSRESASSGETPPTRKKTKDSKLHFRSSVPHVRHLLLSPHLPFHASSSPSRDLSACTTNT